MKKKPTYLGRFAGLAAYGAETEGVMSKERRGSASSWFFAGYHNISPFFTYFSPYFSVTGGWFFAGCAF
jgi:hypothetical protein